ncbi:hypothetical protein BAR1_05955 [Profundibacter amoris]|uniref:Uncharacterized protein n=1 Tax=Profundibacter amoris TaxID=2171755 RepID=A0A347UF90_9RHOB|nr:hypothetical protein BAR1_05955 [Profundibacter amoris]
MFHSYFNSMEILAGVFSLVFEIIFYSLFDSFLRKPDEEQYWTKPRKTDAIANAKQIAVLRQELEQMKRHQ